MDIIKKLEFDQIKERLKKYTHIELAAFYVDSLAMLPKIDLIEVKKDLEEAMNYGNHHLLPIIHHQINLLPALMNLKKNGTGNIEFFANLKDLLINVKEILENKEEYIHYPRLNSYISRLLPLDSLRNRLSSVIDKNLSISDRASSELYHIRTSIQHEKTKQDSLYKSLITKYKKYLNSEQLVMKDQGLALPIDVSYKNAVDGVVIGYSQSKSTVFILPVEILVSNQKIEALYHEEEEEILRILRELGKIASKDVDTIKEDFLILTSLDFLFAKVSLAFDMKGIIPHLSEDEFSLLDARHPLLDPHKVVSNSFHFNQEKILLITGPNAGGKTVFLKMVGLFILMHQSGLALPCEEASLPYFNHVYVDIGDQQSLSDHLSTFTSHIKTLREALENVDSSSFVILDELGTGTSPRDGEAIAIGVIEYLHKLNAYAMISSHYDGLKSFALEQDYILNASMIYDEEKMLSTFKIRQGMIGKSYGLEVAMKEGLPKDVLDNAKNYLEKNESDSEKRIKILNDKLKEVDDLRHDLEAQNLALKENMKKVEDEYQKIKLEKEHLMEQVEEEKEELLKETKKEIDELMNEFKNKKEIKLHEVISLKKKIDDKMNQDEIEEDEEVDDTLKIGDRILEKKSSSYGVIKSLSSNEAIVLLDNGLTLRVKKSSLKKVSCFKEKKPKTNDRLLYSTLGKNVPLECNLIGLRVQEGIDALAKYLDDARIMHYKSIRIIHGYGTGRLKKAVWEYLKKQNYIESYRLGNAGEGGAGATVVILK